jgi:hypothetical protein
VRRPAEVARAPSRPPDQAQPAALVTERGSASHSSACHGMVRRLIVVLGFGLVVQSLAMAPSEARITVRKVQPEATPAAAAPPPSAPPARLELALNLPLAKIQAIANLFAFQIDKSGSISGQAYEGTISLSKVTLQSSNDAAHPLALGAHFKFAGHISGQNLVGGGTTTLNLALKVGPDWCPIVDLTAPSTQWDNDIDAPLPVKVAIRFGLVDHIIASELTTLTECAALKGYLAGLWQPAVIRLFGTQGGANNTAVFLNLRPQAVEVSSIDVKGDRILLKLAIAGSAAIAGKPASSAKLALPNPTTLTHSAADADKSDVSLRLYGDVVVGP